MKGREGAIIRPDWVETWHHYVFRQLLLQKAELVRGCRVIIFEEPYTSGTCVANGNIHEKLGGNKSFKYPNQLLVCCGPGCERSAQHLRALHDGQRDRSVSHNMCGSSSPLPNTTHPIHVLSSLWGLAHTLGIPERPKGAPPVLSSTADEPDQGSKSYLNAAVGLLLDPKKRCDSCSDIVVLVSEKDPFGSGSHLHDPALKTQGVRSGCTTLVSNMYSS